MCNYLAAKSAWHIDATFIHADFWRFKVGFGNLTFFINDVPNVELILLLHDILNEMLQSYCSLLVLKLIVGRKHKNVKNIYY